MRCAVRPNRPGGASASRASTSGWAVGLPGAARVAGARVRSGVRLYRGTRFIVSGSSSALLAARPQGTTERVTVHAATPPDPWSRARHPRDRPRAAAWGRACLAPTREVLVVAVHEVLASVGQVACAAGVGVLRRLLPARQPGG